MNCLQIGRTTKKKRMKHIHFFAYLTALCLLCSLTSCRYEHVYTYIVRNETGVPIKINPYDYGNLIVQEKVIILNHEEEFTHEYISRNPSELYWAYDYFNHPLFLEVIYNNEKKEIFPFTLDDLDSFEDSLRDALGLYLDSAKIYSNKNPLGYTNLEEPFIFTPEDYENATDCGGDCE